jgi:hypothetical protein
LKLARQDPKFVVPRPDSAGLQTHNSNVTETSIST